MCRSILSLNKIARQIWFGHPFSQRNRTAEKTVRVGVGGDREVRGGRWVGKKLKGRGVGNEEGSP